MKNVTLNALITFLLFALCRTAAHASVAYGSINNFDTVNDTGHECHGFEIEIEDCHSTDVTYTYNYNHYGVPRIEQDDSVPGHPKCRIRWESKKNTDGSWAARTVVPAGPINPTDGHQFTNPNVNFGGEHFGTGFNQAVGAIRYNWLIDNGSGVLVHGGAVQVATPVFTYYPGGVGAAGQVQAVIAPPEPPVPPVKEFGKAVWVKEIKTSTHNNKKIKLRELVSDDPDDADDKNWANGEPDEVEVEWRILQKKTSAADGGANGELAAAPEDLPNGDEVVTRRYEFYKYTGPHDEESGEAMADEVDADGLHGTGMRTYNHHMVSGEWVEVTKDMATFEVVGEFTGAQMAAVDVEAAVGLAEHIGEGEVNTAYAARRVIIEGALPFVAVRDGALPAGMAFDEVTGILSGTPTASGEFIFKVTATDGENDVERNYTLRIAAAGAALAPASIVDTMASPVGTGTTAGDGSYEPGANVTVIATAAAGYRFVNWTDNNKVVSTTVSYTFVIDVNHSLVANFTLDVPQRNILTSAAPVAGGTTSGGGLKDDGSSVTVVATPNAGYAFTNWTEGAAVVSSTANYTFTAIADRALVANFTPLPTYLVSTSATPAAGGTTTGGGSYLSGTSATVTATPNAGYVFWKWTVSGSSVSTSPGYTFTVTANKTLVANFVAAGLSRTIATSANPVAGGSTSGGGTYLTGQNATVVAAPNPGYVFTRWQEGSTTVSTLPSYTFTVAANRTLVAKFTLAWIITTASSPEVGGTTEMDAATYQTGDNARARAFPAADWTFAHWTENGVIVSTNSSYSFNVTGNRALVAHFTSDVYAIVTTTAAPAIGGTTAGGGVYANGDDVILSAAPNAGYAFTGWTLGGELVSTDAEITFPAFGDVELVAGFLKIPHLAVDRAAVAGSLVIAWPADDAGWVLQESTDLLEWVDSTREPTLVGAENKVVVSTDAACCYFRLAHP